MATEVFKKIVWAIDAFDTLGNVQKNAVETLRCLQKQCHSSIYPVHILSPAELNLSAEPSGYWVMQYRPAAEKAIQRLLTGVRLNEMKPPVVLLQNTSSTRKTTDLLSQYADAIGADLIVAGTHARTGFSRLLLGSFAETLLLRSRVPVMVVGPQMHKTCELGRVLMPTEFGESAKTLFKRVVGVARELGSKLTLYHAIPRPIEPVFQSGVYPMGSPWMPVQDFYVHELARHKRHAESWARWATHHGVETDVVIDAETTHISDTIVKLAQKLNVGWIAMAAHNGPVASALFGSITRQVIRVSDCPVWVLKWPLEAHEDTLTEKKSA